MANTANKQDVRDRLRLISEELTEGFLHIEAERLRPSFRYDRTAAVNLYQNDPILHARVNSIVGHVMNVIEKHLDAE